MSEYNLGEEVIINVSKSAEEGPKVMSYFPDSGHHVGTVIRHGTSTGGIKISFEGVSDFGGELWVNPNIIEGKTTSCQCESRKVYHDKKEKWICPFCDIDD